MNVFQLPNHIQNIILDDFINISSYWKNLFTQDVISKLNYYDNHIKKMNGVYTELYIYFIHKKVNKLSDNTIISQLYKYNCAHNGTYYFRYNYKEKDNIKSNLILDIAFETNKKVYIDIITDFYIHEYRINIFTMDFIEDSEYIINSLLYANDYV
jgi:hypothetical protein